MLGGDILIQAGLGDALMAQPVIKELGRHNNVQIHSSYPEVFEGLEGVKSHNARAIRNEFKKLFWYVNKPNAFDQLCKAAKIEPPEFKLQINGGEDVNIDTRGKKLCLVKMPYKPDYICNVKMHYERFAGDEQELRKFIERNKSEYYFVSVGAETNYIYESDKFDIDEHLDDKFDVMTFLRICEKSDLIVSQLGHMTAIACLMRKKIKILTSNRNNPKLFQMRYEATVIPGTCEVIE